MTSTLLVLEDFLSRRQRRWLASQLRDRIEPTPGRRILDVGGGTGAVTELLVDGSPAVVLEPSARKAAHGRGRRPGIRFVEGVVEDAPFPDASFERATSVASFHHFRDQAAGLREIRRVLTPNGRLVLADIDAGSPNGRLARFLENDVLGNGCAFRTAAEARQLIEEAGFREVDVGSLPYAYVIAATR